jgi:hypothetical protein
MLDREEDLSAVNPCMARLSLCAFFLLAALAPAQDLPDHETLRAAIAIEELEHDADGALARYAAIEADATLPEGVRRHAALRLGRLLLARGEIERGNAALARAATGEDAVAKTAREIVARSGEFTRDAELARRAEALIARICGESTTWGAAMPQNAIEDLAWFGDHAVPAIRRRLAREDLTDASKGTLIAALWRECSPAKLELLEAVFSGPHAMTAARTVAHLRQDEKHSELVAALLSRLLPRLDDEVGAALLRLLPVVEYRRPRIWQRCWPGIAMRCVWLLPSVVTPSGRSGEAQRSPSV